jgi:hypothetical protein
MQQWSRQSIFHRPLSAKAQGAYWESWRQETASHQRDDIDMTNISNLIMQGEDSLGKLATCFHREIHYSAVIRRLRDALKLAHRYLDRDVPASEQFDVIWPFTCWFSRDASSCYIAVSNREPRVLIFLLHIYATVLLLTIALPATDFSIFASFRIRAILEICQALNEMGQLWCVACNDFHQARGMVEFPLSAVKQYCQVGAAGLDVLT